MSKKSFIYKIVCKDESVTKCYVGSTSDINKRRRDHKTCCNNPNNRKHNQYKYQFIRENGGWDNFTLKKIKTVHYDDKSELLNKERRWVERLGATLNKQVPSRTNTEYDKQYYESNKQVICAKHNEKHTCVCGGRYTYSHKPQHFRTKKHQDYLSSRSNTTNNSDSSDSDTRCKQCGRHDDFCRCGAGDDSFWWGE